MKTLKMNESLTTTEKQKLLTFKMQRCLILLTLNYDCNDAEGHAVTKTIPGNVVNSVSVLDEDKMSDDEY